MNRYSLVSIVAACAAGLLLLVPMFTAESEPAEFLPEPRAERIVDLPEDGDLWQLIIVYADEKRDPHDRKLAEMLATTPRLQSLMAQTKVYELSPNHFWAKDKLAGKALPGLVLQAVEPAPNNKLARPIYSISRDNMPASGEALADEIQTTIERIYPEVRAKRLARDCPNCVPVSPNQRPNDSRRPANTRIPDMRPTLGQPGQKGDLTFVLGLLAAAAAAAYASSVKKN